MFDTYTFLTTLYVIVDDLAKQEPPASPGVGRQASLTESKVVTLALFGQWEQFPSERAFHRYATHHLRGAFPTLPDYGQFNRLVRQHSPAIDRFFVHMVERLGGREALYEAMDTTAAPTRNAKRRGRGWLAGLTSIGWSNRLGWFEGFRALLSTNPDGIITGFAYAPANTNDRTMAGSSFALRSAPDPRLQTVGARPRGPYVLDRGFEGRRRAREWLVHYHVQVIYSPHRASHEMWPKAWRLLAGVRQVVETVYEKLLHTFRLGRERPHELSGFHVRLSAKMAPHNLCIWLNQQSERPWLAFADLIDW